MLTVASQFSQAMKDEMAFVEVLDATMALARQDAKGFRSKHAISTHGLIVHTKARSLSTAVVGLDGTYLSICAQFEMAIRQVVEKYVVAAGAKKSEFGKLPPEIRQWNVKGCAYLMANLDRDQFKHLTEAALISSLHGCLNSPSVPYQLTPEAFSYNERNFKSDMISNVLKTRLGVKDVWKVLSSEPMVMTFFGSTTPKTTEKLLVDKLNTSMERRNSIIHRGKHYYTASNSEILDTAKYFEMFLGATANVLTTQLSKI